jgi:hypothetical protein
MSGETFFQVSALVTNGLGLGRDSTASDLLDHCEFRPRQPLDVAGVAIERIAPLVEIQARGYSRRRRRTCGR